MSEIRRVLHVLTAEMVQLIIGRSASKLSLEKVLKIHLKTSNRVFGFLSLTSIQFDSVFKNQKS